MPSYKTYITGFVLSVILTLAAYFAVVWHAPVTLWIIMGLAIVQLVVQMVFFLHLGKGKDAGWNLVVLFSTFCIILIVVVGSLWIMNHLNYNMSPGQINKYMKDQGAF